MKLKLSVLTLLVSSSAFADVDPTFRLNNAVVLYDFAETSGNIMDKSKPISGKNQVNLAPVYGGRNINRGAGYLSFDAPDALVSTGPADKITDTCKASGAMSYEVWLENNETVIERSGFDSTNDNTKRPHPLRILNLSQLSANTNVTANIGGTNVSCFRLKIFINVTSSLGNSTKMVTSTSMRSARPQTKRLLRPANLYLKIMVIL
ncbi:MAG: hypothetical protein K2P92_01065 [Bdellovibrionaceae bacterium]|nr:hypothetical protein [Pseudobdellovibrionaceae bacterium]